MDFHEFPKIPRLFRPIVITEKIDGTNVSVMVDENGRVTAGSHHRPITPEDDNYGFAAWVRDHEAELLGFGPGQHYGEWWGQGINRGYDLTEKRFSLFNVSRWADCPECGRRRRPFCCEVVPVLSRCDTFSHKVIQGALNTLKKHGSVAAPGFMRPEGIVIFHERAGQLFKVTLEGDQEKGANNG